MDRTIANHSIYGEYKKPEDKVTAALLQVLHYGGHKIVCSVFDDIDLPSNDINVLTQIKEKDSNSIPDGVVSCDCKYKIYIESKIVQNAVVDSNEHAKEQLSSHSKLSKPNDAQWMIYVTPDKDRPQLLNAHQDIIWINWQTVVERLKGYETTDGLINFLIEQFCIYVDHIVFSKNMKHHKSKSMIFDPEEDKNQRVIIVGGAWGEEVALNYGFYACQSGRFFLPAKYLAFYHKKRIRYLFEIIEDPIESTILSKELVGNKYLTNKEPGYDNTPRKFFRLQKCKEFCPKIENDTKDKHGKPCAFTYNQRYTTYDAIIDAKKTSDL